MQCSQIEDIRQRTGIVKYSMHKFRVTVFDRSWERCSSIRQVSEPSNS